MSHHHPSPTTEDPLRLEDLPMADDRTAGYGILREAGPLVKVEKGYLVTRREDCDHVLKNPEVFSSEKAFDTLGSPVPLIPIALDPPEHTRFRRLLQPFFTPRAAARLEESTRRQVNRLIDGVIDAGACDMVADIARPIPAEAFLTLLGLPEEDRDRLLVWKDAIVDFADLSGSAEPPPAVRQAAGELFGYVTEYVARCRAGEIQSMVAELMADPDDPLTEQEALGLCFFFVLSSIDSVTSALSLMFAKFAARKDVRELVVQDPSAIPRVAEEMLRVDPANCVVPRVTTRDVELYGHRIPAGTSVSVALGAANRDPAEYHDPDVMDFHGRDAEKAHLTFGGGAHRCLGIHLARMEIRVVLEEWHRRIPEYELAPGARPQVIWPAGVLRIDSVPVVFPPGGKK